jgi:hypothetical protein
VKQYWLLAIVAFYGTSVADARLSIPTQGDVSKVAADVELVLGKSEVIVRVTNLGTLALEAWSYSVTYALDSGSSTRLDVTVDAFATVGDPMIGPINPGETRASIVALPGIPIKGSVRMLMAMWVDLSSEGSPQEKSAVFRSREQTARALEAWIGFLQGASGRSAEEAKGSLRRVLASEDERLRADPSDGNGRLLHRAVEELLTAETDSAFADRLAVLRQKLESQRQLALRHRGR